MLTAPQAAELVDKMRLQVTSNVMPVREGLLSMNFHLYATNVLVLNTMIHFMLNVRIAP